MGHSPFLCGITVRVQQENRHRHELERAHRGVSTTHRSSQPAPGTRRRHLILLHHILCLGTQRKVMEPEIKRHESKRLCLSLPLTGLFTGRLNVVGGTQRVAAWSHLSTIDGPHVAQGETETGHATVSKARTSGYSTSTTSTTSSEHTSTRAPCEHWSQWT